MIAIHDWRGHVGQRTLAFPCNVRLAHVALAADLYRQHQLALAAATAAAVHDALPVHRHGNGAQIKIARRSPEHLARARIHAHHAIIKAGINEHRFAFHLDNDGRRVGHDLNLARDLPALLAGGLVQRHDVAGAGIVLVQENHQVLKDHRGGACAMPVLAQGRLQLRTPFLFPILDVMRHKEILVVVTPGHIHQLAVGGRRGGGVTVECVLGMRVAAQFRRPLILARARIEGLQYPPLTCAHR